MKFLVINGPNLNLTQFTEPGMEGQIDFNTLLEYIEAGCAQMFNGKFFIVFALYFC